MRYSNMFLLSVATLVGCGGDDAAQLMDPGQGPIATTSVNIVDFSFTPPDIRVIVSDTVTWNWQGSAQHNVTFDNPGVGNSPTQNTGTFSRGFGNTGTFTYFCTVHGRSVMSGSVLVETSP